MEKKMSAVAFILVIFIVSASWDVPAVSAQGVNCIDNCETGCVQPNQRLQARCMRKCQIRCGPDSRAADLAGHF
ncbi:OLC1v1002543C1 [Oldenlandia corymbosa var. corymbosa]|uniref:OLC1v1002543C1 n=1 Tax=Oldenlandia corymbosa var. corymbosa TaxID=529605 RepID=A0AAV1D7V5_OLDCO|nr:OLC1v1002543C1 [Oldenlandia corymbosa var. corymbosa]